MKPLKFEPVNGYGVLIDKTPQEVLVGEWCWLENERNVSLTTNPYSAQSRSIAEHYIPKVIFAEKELNLEGVPVFDWRNFEMRRRALNLYMSLREDETPINYEQFASNYITIIESNPAKYTEEDLRKAFNTNHGTAESKEEHWQSFIQSLQKYPKYVVMESEEKSIEEIQKELGIYGHDEGLSEREFEEYKKSNSIYKHKLFTNSQGKQQGTVKELIWE